MKEGDEQTSGSGCWTRSKPLAPPNTHLARAVASRTARTRRGVARAC